MRSRDDGFTILEVAIALVILMIGIGFIMQSDQVSFRYRAKLELRQQMMLYAAGQLEALIEGQEVSDPGSPYSNFQVDKTITPDASNPKLEKVEVKVYLRNSPTSPEPVRFYTYRVVRS